MPITASSLFSSYFRPLYPTDLASDDALVAAREIDANPAKNPQFARTLAETAIVFAQLAPRALGAPSLALDFTDASVHHLGAALDRRARDRLLEASKPGDPEAPIVQVVVHGAAYVGECIVRAHGGRWGVRRPLWESVVHLTSKAGEGALTPFHWWLKSLADDEIELAGLVARYRQYVERASLRLEDVTPIVEANADRKLPTLKIVRYDLLYKHLRAHLPELRDLGRDFPSPEAFADLGFLELGFLLLGEGRFLLMHGRGKRGLHVFWLDREGFSHAALFPASPGDPASVTVEDDKLVVQFTQEGTQRRHEMLWWG